MVLISWVPIASTGDFGGTRRSVTFFVLFFVAEEDRWRPNCNRRVGFGELMSVRSSELELQALMVGGLGRLMGKTLSR